MEADSGPRQRVVTPESYLGERLGAGERLAADSDLISPSWRRKKFLTSTKVSLAVRKALEGGGFPSRPYVLRGYCDTQLMMAESRGKMIPAYRQFFMGHVGDIEARYTTNKGKLPSDLIDDMRDAYRRSLPFLETGPKKGGDEEEMKRSFRRQILGVAGFSDEEIGKIDLSGMDDGEFQRKVRERLVGAGSAPPQPADPVQTGSQRVVSLGEVAPMIEMGWQWVTPLPDGRAVLRRHDSPVAAR